MIKHLVKQASLPVLIDKRQVAKRAIVKFVDGDIAGEAREEVIEKAGAFYEKFRFFPPPPPPNSGW